MKREDIKTAEEILSKYEKVTYESFGDYDFAYSPDDVKSAMKEYARQFIDLAAEEAEVSESLLSKSGLVSNGKQDKIIELKFDTINIVYRANKQSILNIKELIK
jgi:hypothetical protein